MFDIEWSDIVRKWDMFLWMVYDRLYLNDMYFIFFFFDFKDY